MLPPVLLPRSLAKLQGTSHGNVFIYCKNHLDLSRRSTTFFEATKTREHIYRQHRKTCMFVVCSIIFLSSKIIQVLLDRKIIELTVTTNIFPKIKICSCSIVTEYTIQQSLLKLLILVVLLEGSGRQLNLWTIFLVHKIPLLSLNRILKSSQQKYTNNTLLIIFTIGF